MATRERILEAAAELFAQYGFDGTSVRMIAERAEANQAAVNYHFGSKDGLLNEIMRSELSAMRDVIAAARAVPGDLETRVRQLIRMLVSKLWERRQWVRIIVDAALHRGEQLPVAVAEEIPRNLAMIMEFLGEDAREGVSAAADRRLAALHLMAPIVHLVVFGEFSGQVIGLDLTSEAARDIFAEHHARLFLLGAHGHPAGEKLRPNPHAEPEREETHGHE